MTVKVAGVHYRRPNALAFANAVRKAEQRGTKYGVRLEREPENPHDPNAIAVYGVVETKRWLLGQSRKEWHIGYLPRDLAAELHDELISAGVPIAAELYGVYEDDYEDDDGNEVHFINFKVLVLAPSGYSHSARSRAS